MANSTINLVPLDFDSYKTSLKAFLQAQDQFKDYDFEGSNISVILDLLARNTFQNAFYLNMIGAEMFLDSCQLFDSAVSSAKDLNYTPRSFRSALADVDLIVTSANTSRPFITVPKGTTFTSKVGSNNFTFSTDQNIVVDGITGVFRANNVFLFEGTYLSDSFVVNRSIIDQRFIITNPTVDTDSLTMIVSEHSGANVYAYSQANSLFDITANSQVFFLQCAENQQYEILFGDGVLGRAPVDGATITANYRVCSGELPNGAGNFTSDGPIDNEANVHITTNTPATGGAVIEDLASIKFNAPRRFTTQERAVSDADYEILLKDSFPEITAVHAFGGQTLLPPQYGKVFIALKIAGFAGIPDSKRREYTDFITRRNSTSIIPVFQNPDSLYLSVTSKVNYNVNLTDLTVEGIRSLIINTILTYDAIHLEDFNTTFRFSKFTSAIDDAHPSIISNDTKVVAMRKFNPDLGTAENIIIDFHVPLLTQSAAVGNIFKTTETQRTITSSMFVYNSQTVSLEDDGNGIVNIIKTFPDGGHLVLAIGTVDYSTGHVQLNGIKIEDYPGDAIRVYAVTESVDIPVTQSSIILIPPDEIDIMVFDKRE